LDVVFLCLPHGESAAFAAALLGQVGSIIDLSGDLRLADAETYRAWYEREHPAPHLLGQAAYGLPEMFPSVLAGAPLVACAGCYATVIQLAAAPALASGRTAPEVVVNATSGTTGAGRKGGVEISFSEVAENLRAYRVGVHPHTPEIEAGLQRHCGRRIRVTFVPHLGPLRRGIFASVVLRDVSLGSAEALQLYREAYAGCPFVRVVDAREALPEIRDVAGTNFCDLAPVVDERAGTLVVLGVLDNLLKGAAGQAVQVMNGVFRFPESAGLLPPEQGAMQGVHLESVG